MSDLEFYNKQDKEELVSICIARDNKINSLKQENKQLKDKIDKATNKNQYIIDYGFDYDGFNKVESLKGLIDMLVDYAVQVKHILGDKE